MTRVVPVTAYPSPEARGLGVGALIQRGGRAVPNGVVERWNRTLKEQAVYGRVFRNLAEVRAAVAAFVERYNQCWRLEKLAYRTPSEAREQYELRHVA